MNLSQPQLAPPESVPPRGRRRWFRFTTRQLLALTTLVGFAIPAIDFAIKTFCYTSTTVEIIHFHPTWQPPSVEFLVVLPNGFSQSGVSVPTNTSDVDYSKLVGAKFPIRYRAAQILWVKPEIPQVIAYHLIETKVEQFAKDEQARR